MFSRSSFSNMRIFVLFICLIKSYIEYIWGFHISACWGDKDFKMSRWTLRKYDMPFYILVMSKKEEKKKVNPPLPCLLTCRRGRAWRRGSGLGGRRCTATTTRASPRGSRRCRRGASPSTWSPAERALAAGCFAAAPPTPDGAVQESGGLGFGTRRRSASLPHLVFRAILGPSVAMLRF